jgi:signal transduction histidine kinase
MLRHIVPILGQIVDALGVQLRDETIFTVSRLRNGVFLRVPGDAEIGQRRDRDGVGLGLYIVRTIILSHEEDIYVTSRDGVTEFTFTMPKAPTVG